MAASAKKKVEASDDSSSDDEQLRRCREAVWETRSGKSTDEDNSVKQSKRVVVDDHEHDGNELQVTQGFRAHVANKLELLLDSCITELQCKTSSRVESTECDDDDDEGFRLFSTSIPGTTVEDPPAPVRRRPVPSSSDSDSEMESRLREAAVSLKDLLPLPTETCTAAEPPCSETTRQKEGEESRVVKKKKKKRKPNQKDGAPLDSSVNSQSNGEDGSSEREHTQVKAKRKKKKKRKENAEEEALS